MARTPRARAPWSITIVTGPIRSGKTTRLSAWIAEQQSAGVKIDGVLAPIVNGCRHLRSIADDSSRCLELAPGEDPPAADEVRIGPHRFSGAVFAWARELLIAAAIPIPDRRAQLIVIDEIGPLELRGEGLEPAVSAVVTAVAGVSAAAESAAGAHKPVGDERTSPHDRESPTRPRLVLVVREGLVDRVIEHYRLGPICEVRRDMRG